MDNRKAAFLHGYLSKSASISSKILKSYAKAYDLPKVGLPASASKNFNRYMTGKDVEKAKKSLESMLTKQRQFDLDPSKRVGYGLASEKIQQILKARQRAQHVGQAGKAGIAAGSAASQITKEEPKKEVSDNKELQKESNLKTNIVKAYAAPKAAVKLPGLRPEQKLDKLHKKYLSYDNIDRAKALMSKNIAKRPTTEGPERAANVARAKQIEKIWLKAHANKLKGRAAETAVLTPPAYYGAQAIDEKLNKDGDK